VNLQHYFGLTIDYDLYLIIFILLLRIFLAVTCISLRTPNLTAMNTIVLQDNDKDLLDLLAFVLREERYVVHVTSTLDEHILELVADAKPHVVMIDYKLNGQDAIRACHLIRAFYPDLPVIATNFNSHIQDKYQSDGFDDYLDKPFNLAVLIDLVRRCISPLQLT